MTRISLGVLTTMLLLAATGCSSTNRIVGHDMNEVGRWYGELGITGHLNKISIQARSRLTKLSIFGDANQVEVADGASLGKIEIWGENNVVSIPGHLVVRVAQVGDGNRVVRRAPVGSPASDQTLSGNTTAVYIPPDETYVEPVGEPELEPGEPEADVEPE